MQNYFQSQSNARFELQITGYHPATTVTVTVKKSTFQRTMLVNDGETVTVLVPTSVEMLGTNIFDGTVLIQADKDISVFSFSYKDQTSGATGVLPVHQLGTSYYVVTPVGDMSNTFKEFAVVAHQAPTRVDVHLTGAVVFKGHVYGAGSKLVVDLSAFQAIQLQSTVDLSGTRVESQELVAVLTGHSCAVKNTGCDHVVEQLLPVTSWGTTFIVPLLCFQSRFDMAYIIASQSTRIEYRFGTNQQSRNVIAGQVFLLDMQPSQPLYISAEVGIQVLFFFSGVSAGNGIYDPFLINIPPIANYCKAYHVEGMTHFNNYAVIVVKTSESSDITLKKKAIGNIQWKPIPGTEYSWGQHSLGTEAIALSLEHPSSPFGLFIFGTSHYNGYGSVALCSCSKYLHVCIPVLEI